MTLELRQASKIVVICPASLTYVWKSEYKKWADKEALIVPSYKLLQKKQQLYLDAPVLIINYENLRGSSTEHAMLDFLLNEYRPDGLIVDEAHRCKERTTLNFRAVNSFHKVRYRLYLTGTPAPNRPEEIWALLHFIAPKEFTSYWNFIEHFFSVSLNVYSVFSKPVRVVDGIKPECKKELAELISSYAIMTKRADVMPWLPKEESPTSITLPPTKEQLKYIESLEKDFMVGDIECDSVLTSLVRMRQILNAPAILNLKGKSPKEEWLKAYVKDYPERSILIFSTSTKMLRLLSGVLPAKLIIGETPAKKRMEYVRGFQEGFIKILLIQTQTGKEGLTLDMADVTIFIDTYPPAADYNQAKDRSVATSKDRVKPKQIIHLMMKDTYDERLYELVERNIKTTDVINDYINYIRRN